jgi:diguanylate cyclase (GGDEF)-like protein
VINAGHSLTVPDMFNSPYISPRIAGMFPAKSLIGLPLIAGEKKLGAVLIAFNQPHQFTGEEIDLGEQAAAQIALAIAKTYLLEGERKRIRELEALRANVTDISGVREVPELLRAILERATSMLKATGGDIGLYDEQMQEIEIIASHNLGSDHAGMRMALGEGGMGTAIEQKRPLVIEDYATWERRSTRFLNANFHAAMAVPLRFRDRIVGALGILDADPSRKFSPEDEQLLELFAQQAAIAVENARLYAIEKQRAAELAVLFEASTAITKSINQFSVASSAAERLARAVNATSAHILSCDLEEGTATVIAEFFSLQAIKQERKSDINQRYDLNDYPCTLSALRSGQPTTILIGDAGIDLMDREELNNYGVKSSLNVPMIASGRVLAYAEIWDSASERTWTDEEIRICQTLANQAAVALDNARLYSEMQQMAITDPLTGAYNRRGLFEFGQHEMRRSQRNRQPLTGIMLDIDHFKKINDTFSHAVGDQVLQGLAEICGKHLRSSDILGRYGGEEFAVLLPDTDCQAAYQIAERLRERIAATPIQTKVAPIYLTVSIGIACSRDGIADLAILLDRADTAMYAAKNRGRNLVVPSAGYGAGVETLGSAWQTTSDTRIPS